MKVALRKYFYVPYVFIKKRSQVFACERFVPNRPFYNQNNQARAGITVLRPRSWAVWSIIVSCGTKITFVFGDAQMAFSASMYFRASRYIVGSSPEPSSERAISLIDRASDSASFITASA